MTEIIKIKRSDVTATPVSLEVGELAYSENSGNLFIGRIADGVPVKIGGKLDVDKLAGIDTGAQVNDVDSVAGRTGAVVITSSDLADFSTAADARIAAASLSDLSDVYVTAPSDGQALIWDTTNGWQPEALPSGVTEFVALNDTPVSYASKAGQFVRVNQAENALEYIDGIDGGTF